VQADETAGLARRPRADGASLEQNDLAGSPAGELERDARTDAAADLNRFI
jgi:hypothetical protein